MQGWISIWRLLYGRHRWPLRREVVQHSWSRSAGMPDQHVWAQAFLVYSDQKLNRQTYDGKKCKGNACKWEENTTESAPLIQTVAAPPLPLLAAGRPLYRFSCFPPLQGFPPLVEFVGTGLDPSCCGQRNTQPAGQLRSQQRHSAQTPFAGVRLSHSGGGSHSAAKEPTVSGKVEEVYASPHRQPASSKSDSASLPADKEASDDSQVSNIDLAPSSLSDPSGCSAVRRANLDIEAVSTLYVSSAGQLAGPDAVAVADAASRSLDGDRAPVVGLCDEQRTGGDAARP